jgi:hypothetical protein
MVLGWGKCSSEARRRWVTFPLATSKNVMTWFWLRTASVLPSGANAIDPASPSCRQRVEPRRPTAPVGSGSPRSSATIPAVLAAFFSTGGSDLLSGAGSPIANPIPRATHATNPTPTPSTSRGGRTASAITAGPARSDTATAIVADNRVGGKAIAVKSVTATAAASCTPRFARRVRSNKRERARRAESVPSLIRSSAAASIRDLPFSTHRINAKRKASGNRSISSSRIV